MLIYLQVCDRHLSGQLPADTVGRPSVGGHSEPAGCGEEGNSQAAIHLPVTQNKNQQSTVSG